jgi:hypothetical protein
MNVSIYNKKWVVPAKCGSRYLDALFGITTQYNSNFGGIEYSSPHHIEWEKEVLEDSGVKLLIPSESIQHYGFLPLTHIVLRDPVSQLHSALHTDLWAHTGYWIPGIDNRVGVDEIEDVNPHFLKTLLMYTTTGTGHYSPTLYQNVWYLLQRNRGIEVIQLSELTSLCEKSGYRKEYQADKYNWEVDSTDITREELIGYIESTYPTIWRRITDLHSSDILYYQNMNNHPDYPTVNGLKLPPDLPPTTKVLKLI